MGKKAADSFRCQEFEFEFKFIELHATKGGRVIFQCTSMTQSRNKHFITIVCFFLQAVSAERKDKKRKTPQKTRTATN